jgi:hypothetical protein
MSHFSVLVRVPGHIKENELESYITKMMIPYKEYGCGEKDDEASKQYIEFHDEEDKYLKEYKTKTSEMIRLASGEQLCCYDDSFKNPKHRDTLLDITERTERWVYPKDSKKIKVRHTKRFATFEEFMKGWHGSDNRDKVKNRYGYWQNPNKKWDWWTIGGRWTGHLKLDYDPAADVDNYRRCMICGGTGSRGDIVYSDSDTWARQPTAAGHPVIGTGCNGCHGTGFDMSWNLKPVGNYLRINQLNWRDIRDKTYQAVQNFYDQWEELCNGKEFPPFSGPRSLALDLGLLDYKSTKELTGTEWKVIPWDKEDTPKKERRNRCDVLKPTTKEWLLENAFDYFIPIGSYARLDDTGWQSKGEMGWFGCSHDTVESVKEHSQGLVTWLKNGEQMDWLVVVDCHI